MTLIALYDTETNGLLTPKRERDGSLAPAMNTMHTLTMILWDTATKSTRHISAADKPGYEIGETHWVKEELLEVDGKAMTVPTAIRITAISQPVPPGVVVWERMPLLDALKLLDTGEIRVGQNIQDFDERAIPIVFPWWKGKEGTRILDTLIMSRCIFPDIHRTGPNTHKVYGFLKNAHSLKAWGMRLGTHKGDYKGGWAQWSEGMQRYGEQDTVVLFTLFKYLMSQKPAQEMLDLEHDFAAVIRRQESRGFAFDHPQALVLLGELKEVEVALEAALIETFGEWWEYGKSAGAPSAEGSLKGREGAPPVFDADEDDEDLEDEVEQAKRAKAWYALRNTGDVKIPTKTRQTKMIGFPDVTRPKFSEKTGKELKPYVGPPLTTYTQGAPYTPIKRVQFNPGSRTHIIKRLVSQFNWEPSKFTKKTAKGGGGNPIVDDSILRALPWPEVQKLADYFLVLKRLGQLANGQKAWLKVAVEYPQPNGTSIWRIHGRVNTNGAGTGRCTHSDPNVAQAPKNSAEAKNPIECVKGYRYRELFYAPAPYELVGFDGAALELRELAHYIAPWDKGEYAKIVDEGRRENRTDPHSWLCLLIGEDLLGDLDEEGRDHAKTGMYAELYGAGEEKMGAIVIPQASKAEKVALGRKIKDKMASRFTAKTELQKAITKKCEDGSPLKGLDKRSLYVRKPHAALNTLLQSAGAVTMKKALVLLDAALQAHGLKPGSDYEFVANIHDEAQAEVLPQHVALFKELAERMMVQAGIDLRLKCPLKAEASSGPNWRHTH